MGTRKDCRTLLSAALIALGATEASAAEPLVFEAGPDWDVTLRGRLRPRFVAHSGRDFLGDRSEWRELVTQRARLGLLAEEVSGLTVLFELQDVRIWGEEEDETTDFDAAGLDVHQAWARLPILNELSLMIGRQEIVLDEERIVGNLDWTQRGRAFDGVRLSWAPAGGRYTLDGFYAKVREPGRDPDGNVPDDFFGDTDFGGVHGSIEFLAAHELSPMYVVNAKRATEDVRHTAGLYLGGATRGISYRAEGYYQFGSFGDEGVNALLAALRLGYTFDVPVAPGIFVWAEALSGNGSMQGTFDVPYGTNHDYYGEMDFFLDIPADTNNFGLVDLGGRAAVNVLDRLDVQIDGHYFRTFESTPNGSSLGVEIEPKVVYRATDYVTLRGLYGVFLPDDALTSIRGYAPDQALSAEHFAYLTTDVQF